MPIFTARNGCAENLGNALSVLQQLSQKDEGCIAYSVFVDLDHPERFVLYEEWATDHALEQHNERQHVRDFLAESADWLDDDFTVARLRPVAPRAGEELQGMVTPLSTTGPAV